MNCPNCNKKMQNLHHFSDEDNVLDDDLFFCRSCNTCWNDQYWWMTGVWPLKFFQDVKEFKRWLQLKSFE